MFHHASKHQKKQMVSKKKFTTQLCISTCTAAKHISVMHKKSVASELMLFTMYNLTIQRLYTFLTNISRFFRDQTHFSCPFAPTDVPVYSHCRKPFIRGDVRGVLPAGIVHILEGFLGPLRIGAPIPSVRRPEPVLGGHCQFCTKLQENMILGYITRASHA